MYTCIYTYVYMRMYIYICIHICINAYSCVYTLWCLVVAIAAAQRRLAKIVTVVGGSVADRAAAAVNDLIAGNRAGNAGATQNRASAMVNSLMAGRLPQKIEHILHAFPHQPSHILPAAPAPVPVPAPATLTQNQHHLYQYWQQYAYPK